MLILICFKIFLLLIFLDFKKDGILPPKIPQLNFCKGCTLFNWRNFSCNMLKIIWRKKIVFLSFIILINKNKIQINVPPTIPSSLHLQITHLPNGALKIRETRQVNIYHVKYLITAVTLVSKLFRLPQTIRAAEIWLIFTVRSLSWVNIRRLF